MNINEEKASTGNIKPQILKLGSKWGHDIIFRIIRQIWHERRGINIKELNESKVILLSNGNKALPENYRPITLRHMILNILDRWLQLKITKQFENNNSY